MSAQLRVLTGARAGAVVPVVGEIVVGRQADAGLRFDPEQDLDVSGLHAVIVFDAGRWVVRDLGSRNATFLNGRRVNEADLHDGDRIRFGAHGPEVEFTSGSAARAPGATGSRASHAGAREPVTQIVRTNQRLRWTTAVLGIGIIGVVATALWFTTQQQSEWQRERDRLLSRIDSVLVEGDATAQALTGEREGLAEALQASQAEVRRVRGELEAAAAGDTVSVADLRQQLQTALVALERQQLAAALDYTAIEALTRRAVAMVWVENADRSITTGTAFAVRPDGTLITSGHVVAGVGSTVSRPRRIGVQFSDSDQVWPARILQVDGTADLAVIKVDNIVGSVPIIASINARPDTIAAGSAVAWIGFALGGESWPQGARDGSVARPLGTVGVITGRTSETIEFQGYGAAGASGSPILDRNGAVIAVLMGGRGSGPDGRLVGVPASAVAALLSRTR